MMGRMAGAILVLFVLPAAIVAAAVVVYVRGER